MDQATVISGEERSTDRRAWWTEADQAELNALLWELVDGIFEHRPSCASCARGFPPCSHIRKAIEVVLDWRQARQLRSYARHVRLQRELCELEQDVLIHRMQGQR